jgi:molecular chaperone GrpE
MNFNDMLKKKKKENSETPENTVEIANENNPGDEQE